MDPSDRRRTRQHQGIAQQHDLPCIVPTSGSRYTNGVVALTGFVRSDMQKTQAERDVKQKIEDALKRSAELEANRITVETVGSKVTLRGSVRS